MSIFSSLDQKVYYLSQTFNTDHDNFTITVFGTFPEKVTSRHSVLFQNTLPFYRILFIKIHREGTFEISNQIFLTKRQNLLLYRQRKAKQLL